MGRAQGGRGTSVPSAGRRRALCVAFVAGVTALAPAPPTMAATVPANPVTELVVADATEPVLTDNFNPFDASTPLFQLGVPSYIYEPLMQYNELGENQYYPWLASSWSFSSSGSTITFTLRPGVRWDDGSTLTAADVAYTFNLLKVDPDLDDGLPIVSAVASGPSTFILTLGQPGYAYLYDIARVPIVKTGFAAGANPGTYVDKSPDGTGPYLLGDDGGYSPKRVVLSARAKYWQGGPPPFDELVFPAYPNDAAVASALADGALDWSGVELPDVAASYVDKDPGTNHYWGPDVDTIALELDMARGPMATLAVRQAISDAIDRSALSTAMSGGLDPPATSASGLVLPRDGQLLVGADTNDITGPANQATVNRLMVGAGFRRGHGGYWADAKGEVVAFSIEDPVGTDLASGALLLAGELSQAGFQATAAPVGAGQWREDLTDGHFDATILAGEQAPSPYYMYEDWLDPAQLDGGRALGGDYERLDRATAPKVAAAAAADLDDYTDSLVGSSGAQAAVQALAMLVNQDLPVIPLLYGAATGEYSTRHATGWPTSANPYEPASPKAPFAEYTLLQLDAASP
jgi:peptide/nickel transport system substrate-binding protein